MNLKRTTVFSIIKSFIATGVIEGRRRGGHIHEKLSFEQKNTVMVG
jgi:hypothetical protein